MPVRCKLCGIRSRSDLEVAVQAGADAVGFISGVTHVSEDALDAEAARSLASSTPPYVSKVLVTHHQDAGDILRLADFVGADTIQIHGLVDTTALTQVFREAKGRRVTKAVHVTGPDAIDEARSFLDVCDALHLDSRTSDRLGGTGEPHDWAVSREIVRLAQELAGKPVVLSGGLRPSNLRRAIETVTPYAVDVNSGIESDNGDKEPALANDFVSLARSIESA